MAVPANSSSQTSALTLSRYDLSGSLQQSYPTTFSAVGNYSGSVISTPDGTQLVMGATSGLALVNNNGTVAAQLPVPGATYCTVTRWWSPAVALASCVGNGSEPQLYQVPISGAKVTTLTGPPVPPDNGDLNAWQVGNSVYVQSAGACGVIYLSKLTPAGTTSRVQVPQVDPSSSVSVIGASGSRIALQANVACGSGISVLWYDPAQNTSTVVLGPPINGGGVISVLAYPAPLG